MKTYKIKTTSIDYCIEWQDVCDYCEEEDIEKTIATIRNSLPQEIELELTCEEEDVEDMVCDAISQETNWLTNGFTYEILAEQEGDYYELYI